MEILKFGVPTAAVVFLDWGCFEVQAILVGISGVDQLAASVINSNFFVQLYVIPLALSFTSTALIGSAFGEGNKKKAVRHALMVNRLDPLCQGYQFDSCFDHPSVRYCNMGVSLADQRAVHS